MKLHCTILEPTPPRPGLTLLFKDELAILGLCGQAVTQSVICSVKVYYEIRPLRRLVLHMRRG